MMSSPLALTQVRCRRCREFYLHVTDDFMVKVAAGKHGELVCPECRRTGGPALDLPQKAWPANGKTIKEQIIAGQAEK